MATVSPDRGTGGANTKKEYLPHVWILKDPHYSLDAVHCDALLKTAETCRRTEREMCCEHEARRHVASPLSIRPRFQSRPPPSRLFFDAKLQPTAALKAGHHYLCLYPPCYCLLILLQTSSTESHHTTTLTVHTKQVWCQTEEQAQASPSHTPGRRVISEQTSNLSVWSSDVASLTASRTFSLNLTQGRLSSCDFRGIWAARIGQKWSLKIRGSNHSNIYVWTLSPLEWKPKQQETNYLYIISS